MKKIISLLLAVIMVVSLLPTMAFAATTVTTNIMTAEEGGTDTGLRLTGDDEAVYGEDYTVEIRDNGNAAIYIKTSDWKLTGTVAEAFSGEEVNVYAEAAEADMHLIIGDIDQNESNVNIFLRNDENGNNCNADIDITNPLTLTSIQLMPANSETSGGGTLTLNADYPVTVDGLNLVGFGDMKLAGPGTINIKYMQAYSITGETVFDNAVVNADFVFDEEDGAPCPIYLMSPLSLTNGSKLIAVNNVPGEEEFPSMGAMVTGSLTVDETSECFISGLYTAVMADSNGFISADTDWKCSADVVSYANKAEVTDDAEEALTEVGYCIKVKDSNPVEYAKTLYKAGTGTEPESDCTYAITNGTTDTNGSITVASSAAEGDTVTITVNPATGYQLKSLTVTPVTPKYMDWDDTNKELVEKPIPAGAIEVTNTTTSLDDGKFYIVKGADVKTGTLTVNGTATLILMDGAKLTATGGNCSAGIEVALGKTLVITGQKNGTGILVANCSQEEGAGIGGGSGDNGGTVTINGGTVTANGGPGGAGIGGGSGGNGGTVTINGGTVTATGGDDDGDVSEAIGRSCYGSTSGTVTFKEGVSFTINAGADKDNTSSKTTAEYAGDHSAAYVSIESAPANKLLKSPAPKLLKTSTPAAPETITPEPQQDGTYQFTMPGYAVTVTAEFELIPEPEHRSYTTITIGGNKDKEETKAEEVKEEENPDTGAPVMNLGAVAVVLGAAYVLSKKH